MRKALNDNPTMQIAVIGVLVVCVGAFMMMNMKKGSGSSTASTGTPATSASATPGAAAGTAAPVPVPGTSASAVGSTVAPPPVTSGTVPSEALVPGPGLPRPVVAAWKGGNAVVLLVVRGSGIDDRLLRGSVESLSGEPNVSVFVTRAKGVARYSRITQGVGVNRVPALVVVRPRRNGSTVPEAQVNYGFRNSQSVVQAVHDALYTGHDNLPYYPR
jgi:hypothetical protein